MAHWDGMTSEDALAAWDANDLVWTCDMGGMGPGYEQCIQIMAFEMLRVMLANPPKDGWPSVCGDEGKKAWATYRDDIDADPKLKAVISQLGPSGAQHGAAIHIAAKFAMDGYSEAMKRVPEDRRIMVSKTFPSIAA